MNARCDSSTLFDDDEQNSSSSSWRLQGTLMGSLAAYKVYQGNILANAIYRSHWKAELVVCSPSFPFLFPFFPHKI
jgi:hypothetical protein